MKALPEEEKIETILKNVKILFPNLNIPPREMWHFFDSGSYLGLGGKGYGIGINVKITDTTFNFIDTIIHELVHYQGIRGHGKNFRQKYDELMTAYIKKYGGEL